MDPRFVADVMLGRLAKWLRVMGYDTHYQSYCRDDGIKGLVQEGRKLLSRRRDTVRTYPHSLLIRSDRVGGQLQEMWQEGSLPLDRSKWFTRCLRCNVPLEKPAPEEGRENVPDYVLYESGAEIRSCPSCGRFFWAGSHRQRMIRQLEEWGFSFAAPPPWPFP